MFCLLDLSVFIDPFDLSDLSYSRRRRREMRSSVIDVDDTYVIDGEGQPAILALDAQASTKSNSAHTSCVNTDIRMIPN